MPTNVIRKDNYIRLPAPYYVCFQPPRGIDKEDRIFAVRAFKGPTNSSDMETSNKMIKIASHEFYDAMEYNEWCRNENNGTPHTIIAADFDAIVCAPSQFSAATRACHFLQGMYDVPVYLNFLQKRMSQDADIDVDWALSEPSDLTTEYIIKRHEDFRNFYYNKPFEIKHYSSNLRRYVYGFIAVNPEEKRFGSIWLRGKRVLLVDDTIGEGVSLREAANQILTFRPKSVTCFSVVRDYR